MAVHSVGNLREVVSYPSPFFDLSNSAMPDNFDELLDWCIYYYLATPLIPAVVNKLSTYPITDTIIDSEDQSNKQKWDNFLNNRLNVKYKMFELNLDYFLQGSNYTGVYIPFKRSLICQSCQVSVPMNGAKWSVSFKKNKRKKESKMPDFTMYCEVCQGDRPAVINDCALPDWAGINVIRYSPRDIKPLRDPVSGRCKFLWTIPERYKRIIISGRHPDLVEKCPAEILEAINLDGKILLSDKNVYEMRRPSISGTSGDRGVPLVIHALKWTYYLSILQKGQEAIAHEKIVPLDIMFPGNSGTTGASPSQALGMSNFTDKLNEGLKAHRKDPGHKIVMPLPVGTARLGGDGRALMLAAEIDWVSKQIISSMGVPLEFVYGGLTWTGSSITLRMLENSMIGIKDGLSQWLQWLVDKISASFNVDAPRVKLGDLKMADDIQRQQILMNLESMEKIATGTLLDNFDIDFNTEADKILAEADTKARLIINSAVTSAKAQGTAAMVQNDFMMRSQIMQSAQSAEMGMDPATGYPTDANGTPIDPNTGYPIDPQIGLPVEPNSGQYINPETGQPMSPEEVQNYAFQVNQQNAQIQNTQNAPTDGNLGGPGSAVDNAIYSQQEQREDAQGNAAQQAGNYNMAPENLKATVTNLAKQLISADIFTRQQILQNISAKSPALAQIVRERMGMLVSGGA